MDFLRSKKMALGPNSAEQIRYFEGKIDGMLLSQTEDDKEKTRIEFCLSSNKISTVVQQNLITMYKEAGWKNVVFKANNRTIILSKE